MPPLVDFTSLDDWRLQILESRRRPLRIWLWTIAALTLAVLVVGGITRLTHSGLSMVDWQPLVGVVPPLDDREWQAAFDRYRQFPEYQQLRRGMTLAEFKFIFFWEYLHRLSARLIGLVFAVPFAWFWARGHLNRPLMRRALVLFALGGMQGAMGWLMVKSGLVDRPDVSHYRLAAHLALAFVIFGFSVWLARELAVREARVTAQPWERRRLLRGLTLVGALLALQVVWGALVAGLKAGLIFNSFPLMDGALVPNGLLALEPPLSGFVRDPVAVQWTHRLLGTALLAVTLAFFVLVRRTGADRFSRNLSTVLTASIAAQYLLGVLTLVYIVPVPLAVSHQALAMVVFGVWVVWVHHVRNVAAVPNPPEYRTRPSAT